MDLVVSPTIVSLNPQLGTAVPALKAGDIIEAQVLALLGDGRAKLAIGSAILEVQTKVPLTPGTTVRLAVKSTPDGIRLTIVGNPAVSSAPASATTPTSPPASGLPAAPASPAPPASASANASVMTQATTPGVASTTAGTGAPVSAPSAPETAPPQEPNVAPALTQAVQASAARQNGLAPLFADAAVAATSAALPQPVRQALNTLLALRPALAENFSADDVRQAVGRSGLFLEAHLSAAAKGGTAGPRAIDDFAGGNLAGDDLKGALIVLRSVIRTWIASEKPAPLIPQAAPADVGNAPSIVPGPEQGAEARTPAASAAPGPPPPPYRGAPTVAQPQLAPSIAPDMAPRTMAKILLTEADAAISRQTLLQAASLPNNVEQGARSDSSGPRWHFEVPFATPQGTAIAHFEIARDGRRSSAESSRPVWCARFSLDVEPIGPVHAQIALIGARAAVTLWAERADTSTRLRDQARELADALRAADLEPADVLVRFGAPPRPQTTASGRFLDRAS